MVEGGFDVDARTVLRWVRIGRELRFLWRAALFGTLVWGAFVLAVERSTPEGSAQWNRVDADASPGFVLLLVVAAVAGVAQASIRFVGRPGLVAAKIVPLVGPPPPMRVADGGTTGAGLLAALRRRAFVGFGVLTAFVVITVVVVAVAVGLWPAYEGNHGRGGRVVTIGVDATVTSFTRPYTGRGGGGTVYRLETSGGSADAEGNVPHDGQRWTIVHDRLGGDDAAYLVGGHAYVLEASLGLLFLLLDAGVVWFTWLGITTERRRRHTDEATASPSDALSGLAAGTRVTLTVGRAAVGYCGRPIPPLTVVVGSSA